MPLRIVKRHNSPYWYLRGSIRGIRVDESTGTGDQKAAEEIRIKREAEILTRSIHGDTASRSFAEAALSYMEADGERKFVAPLLKEFGRKKLAQIAQDEIDVAARKLYPKAASSTLNRQVYTPMAAILNHAARKGWCPKPVIARPKTPKGRVRWITEEEAERLIEAAAPHLKPLVIFLLSTGARMSEAIYLDWRDVDLSRCHVTFLDTKNGEHRGVPLHPRAVAALANLPHRAGAVFRRPRKGLSPRPGQPDNRPLGSPYEPKEDAGGQVKTAWKTMCRKAGISDFTPHDCRHTWATWHYRQNRDLTALMELGGWKSVEMVMRYAHVNTSHLAPSIIGMWGKDGEQENESSIKTLHTKGLR